MSRYHDLILTRSTDQAIMESCSIKHQMSKPELGRGQWSTCPLKKAGGATWRSTFNSSLRPSCRTFRLHRYIANKGALYVFLSLKLCICFFSLQLLRGQALVKGTRKHSNPRPGGHAGLPGREFAMHRDWALASTLVGGSIRALRRAYICLEWQRSARSGVGPHHMFWQGIRHPAASRRGYHTVRLSSSYKYI